MGIEMTTSVVVARSNINGLEYLAQNDARVTWTDASQMARQFHNVREATRTALRLPGRFRAFALPMVQG